MSGNDTQQDINLADQVAIVTGGGRGIGRAMALGLANAGAAVAVVARSADQLAETVTLIERAGGRAIPATADVTDQQVVERAVAETERQLGPVELVVNAVHLRSGLEVRFTGRERGGPARDLHRVCRRVPISRAVAASACLPVLFRPLDLTECAGCPERTCGLPVGSGCGRIMLKR